MTSWIHSTIVATTLVATAAVGVAGASLIIAREAPAPKADRLPVVADASGYVTIETRHDGVSVLKRIEIR